MGAKKPPKVSNSFFGPRGPQAPIAAPLSAANLAAANLAAADLLAEEELEADMEAERIALANAVGNKAAGNKAAGNKAAADLLAQRQLEAEKQLEADIAAAMANSLADPVGNKAAADKASFESSAENLLALTGSEDGEQDSQGDEPNQKPSEPWEDAPPIEEDAAASAARVAPVAIQFPNIARANLLPLMASGIHPVSTSGGGSLCGLHALIYSYNALRDLSAPEGTPVPRADNPTAKDLQLYKTSPQFYKDVVEFLTGMGFLTFADEKGLPLSEKQVMRQVTGIVPNSVNNYDINILQSILIHLNRTYGTNYVPGHVIHGFNVRWDSNNKVWDIGYMVPTSAQAFGQGLRPILWLYNDNWENESKSLHQNKNAKPIGHWMGFSTLHRNLDQGLIAEANSWFGYDMDEYLNEGVWIVTADVEGYHVDLEDHQDPRELKLYSGNFVRAPTVAPDEDAPDGYMWVQRSPYFVGDVETPGPIGIAPLKSLKKIVKDALRNAHDTAGATAANIIKRTGVIVDDKGQWEDFIIHRTIEPTTKINARYANPNDPAKKFVGGFQFEDGEFLLDSQEPLKKLQPRMIRMDGTRGRVKPRNLQYLERAWMLPEKVPIASSGTKKTPSTSMTPGKQNLLGTSNKSDPKYKYRPTMKAADFKITDLRNHCKARGMVAKDYGRTKVTMLAKLVEYDQKADEAVKPSGNQVGKAAESGNFLPMRRVLVDVAKEAGPPKMPPFFATEIVVELGKGDANNPATWIVDYEGRVGRIDDDNLEPLDGAWGIELDPVRWVPLLAVMRKDLGYNKPSKTASNPPDPTSKTPKTTSNSFNPINKTPEPTSDPFDSTSDPFDSTSNPSDSTSKTPEPASNPLDPTSNPLDPTSKTPKPASKPAGKKTKAASANPPAPNSQASIPPAGKTTGKRPASSSAEPANKKTKKKKKK
ncbi:hypothetical protein BOTCAL_0527g00070 [Botryotinia calthae]|uniref:Uncharacterized protein n=1 Tax=Botryotinia calthae TaxID=38488 RepID=A0A4Y8CLE0_9HELO|nr:hypothetical protein BOTCAL_0527g00070 [Botryotinia calthae]